MSNPKPMVTWPVARVMWQNCEPFRVKLHYVGGSSSKWWQLEYDGTPNGMIECNHGRHGNLGRREPFRYEVSKASDKVAEKLRKGYDYDRRSQTNRPAPKSKPKPKPKITLTGPFAEIRLVKKVGDDHFKAYDEDGTFLLDLDEQGANDVVDADSFRIEMQL
jgi:hypothetical protein